MATSKHATWLAWASMLLLSILPNVLFNELTGSTPAWLQPAKWALLAGLILLSLLWQPAMRLRAYFAIFAAIVLAETVAMRMTGAAFWRNWFAADNFTTSMLSVQLGRLTATLLILLALFALGYRGERAFLNRGDGAAPGAGMAIFGFEKGDSWRRMGPRIAVYIGGAMLVMMAVLRRPSAAAWVGLLPVLPAILFFAAVNAFSEEVSYRATLISTSESVLGGSGAVWLAAVFFGISHYYGVPYGWIGVLLSGFFGWVLGRAMLETRGLFWPWLIHMASDIAIFSFMAMGGVTPGG